MTPPVSHSSPRVTMPQAPDTTMPLPSRSSSIPDSINASPVSFREFLRRLIRDTIQKILSVLSWFKPKQGSARKEPNSSVLTNTFDTLPITDAEKQKIFTIIHAMGNSSWWGLISQKSTLERLGEEIQQVHPLKFLEYIFQHPELPLDLEKAKPTSVIWNPFIKGLEEKLQRETTTLPALKADFARALRIHLGDIDPFFTPIDAESLVRFLLDVKMGRKSSIVTDQATPDSPAASAPKRERRLIRWGMKVKNFLKIR